MAVFKDLRFATAYELFGKWGAYYKYAGRTATRLLEVGAIKRVIDLGCGTGTSTMAIAKNLPQAETIVGVEKSSQMLEFARFKFEQGSVLTTDMIRDQVRLTYPQDILDILTPYDLANTLMVQREISRLIRAKIRLIQSEACDFLDKIDEMDFDAVIASQVFHWFRRANDGTPENPNIEYEKQTLDQIRRSLKQGGSFGFNTTAADFDTGEDFEKHFLNHPFYREFYARLSAEAGVKQLEAKRIFVLDRENVVRSLENSGFKVLDIELKLVQILEKMLIELCLMQANMQFFEKNKIEASPEERAGMIMKALKDTIASSQYKLQETTAADIIIFVTAQKI